LPNRLINETSPYLLQHAHNPVDWYPWGKEAFAKAKAEDKPVLLSVGYSACHWCHVMERESFENPETARLMNERFVNIKVDREERPDVDNVYMLAVQSLTGRGGWPMTVFLTPDGEPFYGGTYFPPVDRPGIPAFSRVLESVAEAYASRKEEIAKSGHEIREHLSQLTNLSKSDDPLTVDILHEAQRALVLNFDWSEGGFGPAPKFPQPMILEFLLRYHLRTGHEQTLQMVELTLQKMALGGMYDQLSGGFHRYSTDARWLVPHFEKMLYDNALLARAYLHAYQVTHEPLYRRIVEETLDYVLREMTSPGGGFYSTQDADSEGEEGKFFVWSKREVIEALGPENGELFCRYYDVTEHGNWEGHNILHVPQPLEKLAEDLGKPEEQVRDAIERGRHKLFVLRQQRIPPARDDKVLTGWNGLMLSALAEAAAVLRRPDYREAAEKAGAFLLDKLRREDGRLLRTYKDGQAKLLGYLEDYSFLIDGLLRLHEATFGRRWLDAAISLADAMVELFWEPAEGAFYDTGRDHEQLILRPRDFMDHATPCGASVAVDTLLRLAVITGNPDYQRIATEALGSVQVLMSKQPGSAGQWLQALDFYLSTPLEIAVIGSPEDASELLAPLYESLRPNRVVVGSEEDASEDESLPLLAQRSRRDGLATVYVCQDYVCQEPVTGPAALQEQLALVSSGA